MTPPTPEKIYQFITGHWASAAVSTAVIHSVFTHIEAGRQTVESLSERAALPARGVRALLDALTGLGLVHLDGRTYRNSVEASEFLVEGKPAYLGTLAKHFFGDMSVLWGQLPEVVARGVPVAMPVDDASDHPYWKELVVGIAPSTAPAAKAAIGVLGLPGRPSVEILDVGGGSGIFSAILLSANPNARSTQIDWPHVNEVARGFVANFGVQDRFSTIDGDFHAVPLERNSVDVVICSHVAHSESPSANIRTFRRLKEVLRPGGCLLVNDFIIDDDRSGPAFPLLFQLQMLLTTREGASYRRADYRDWLLEAGFEKYSFHDTFSASTLIRADV